MAIKKASEIAAAQIYKGGPVKRVAYIVLGRMWNFARALQGDSEFYLRTQALKGGAATAALGGLAVSTIFALQAPLILALAGMALCTGVAAIGVYGVVLGTKAVGGILWDGFRRYILNDTSPPVIKPPGKSIYRRIMDKQAVQDFLKKPSVQKLRHSRVAKAVRALTHDPQDLLLNGFAIEGSVIWAVLSLGGIAAGAVALPVAAIGGFLSIGTVLAVGVIATAAIGLVGNCYGMVAGLRRMKGYMKEVRDDLAANKTPLLAPAKLFSAGYRNGLSEIFMKWAGKMDVQPQQPALVLSRVRLQHKFP